MHLLHSLTSFVGGLVLNLFHGAVAVSAVVILVCCAIFYMQYDSCTAHGTDFVYPVGKAVIIMTCPIDDAEVPAEPPSSPELPEGSAYIL